MKIEPDKAGEKIVVTLDDLESGHLLSYLYHAKFCDDVRLEVVGSPNLRTLIAGLSAMRRQLGFDLNSSEQTVIREGDGQQAPSSFRIIETRLKALLRKDDVAAELAEDLYPYIWERGPTEDRTIMPGSRVLIPRSDLDQAQEEREVGVVIACWQDPETQACQCYVARSPVSSPFEAPQGPPEIVRHWAKDLVET
jgi:hypothetical protein